MGRMWMELLGTLQGWAADTTDSSGCTLYLCFQPLNNQLSTTLMFVSTDELSFED